MRTIFKGWVKLFRDSVTQPWYKEPAARDVYTLLLVMADGDGIVKVNVEEMTHLLGKTRRHYVFSGVRILVEHRVVERVSRPRRPLELRLVKSDENVTLQCDGIVTPSVSKSSHSSVTKTSHQCDENVTLTPYNSNKNLNKNTPHTPQGGIVDENQRKIFDELLSEDSRAIREQLCMSYGITEEVFHDLLKEIAAEWDAVEEPDRSRKHLINTIRIKARLYGNDQKHRRDTATITTSRAKGFKVITDSAVESSGH